MQIYSFIVGLLYFISGLCSISLYSAFSANFIRFRDLKADSNQPREFELSVLPSES